VNTKAPALAPLFRSEQQMRILAALFAGSDTELSIGELAARAGVAQATVSREVARLAEHGLVVTRMVGRTKLVAANWGLSWASELRSILTQTVGVLGLLAASLSRVDGIDEAFVFGSWASRYEGEPGAAPRDVDVVVVGDVEYGDVRKACAKVERELAVEVNAVVVDTARWKARKDAFVRDVRSKPLVPIQLAAA
jgi:DNA-binding transcriptional ArsR family regulator